MRNFISIALIIIAIQLLLAIFILLRLIPTSDKSSVMETDTPIVNSTYSLPPLQSTPSTEEPYPSQVLNLANWKITLPIGKPKKLSSPLEIRQPDLAAYKIEPWFTVTPDGRAVRFRAPVNAPTTGGTKYARSELREMTHNGQDKASWSATDGTHTMFLDQAITAVPKIKQHIVAGQIHDDNDDIIVIRLEMPNLYVNVHGKNVYTLDSRYKLGKRFTVKFVVNNGQTKVFYNRSINPAYTLTLDYDDAYFKAGAYIQSNCDTEGSAELCHADNYAEVTVYNAIITHL